MLKMFFIPLMLFLTTTSIDATFPELPDVNSFMPTILEMVPINGQLRVNDQIFNFGSRATQANSDVQNENQEELRVDPPQTPNNLPQTQNLELRTTPDIVPSPVPIAVSQPRNNGLTNEQNFNIRAQNQLPPVMETIPQSFPISQIPMNFGPRIPSMESILFNMNPQNSAVNTLPNIGSTEIGSTFAGNVNSDFRDEFSQPSLSTPLPFGFPGSGPSFQVRSNLDSTESPLQVMPLVVSPERLLQRDGSGMSSNPIPIPALFASANDNEMTGSERVESLPVSVESLFSEESTNRSTDSTQVMSRQSTIVLPPPTFRQLTNESFPEERNFDSALDRHVMSILRSSDTREQSDSPSIPMNFDKFTFKPKSDGNVPTLAEVEASEKQRSKSIPKTQSNELTIKLN